MKKLKVTVVFLVLTVVFSFFFSVTAFADAKEDLNENFNIIGADKLNDYIDNSTKDYLSQNGIDPKNYNWVNSLDITNVFSHIFSFFKSGLKTPLQSGFIMLGIILLTAAVNSFYKEKENTALLFAVVLIISLIVSKNVWQSISASVSAIKQCSVFMLGLIPVFAAAIFLSGGAVSSVSVSSLLLFAAESITVIADKIMLPVLGAYLSISITGAVFPELSLNKLSSAVKKCALWILSLLSTVFVGILGIQTAVNTSADTLSVKAAKFIVGTCVPFAGNAMAEATSSVYASMSLLKSSLGIYGVYVIAVMTLPVIIELLIWKAVLTACSVISSVFSLSKIFVFVDAVNEMLTVLTVLLLFLSGIFIISLGLVVTVGKTV